MLRALARQHRSESDPAIAQSPCPCRVWHQHKLSACPLKLHLEEIKRDVLAPFSPSKHPGNGERSVRVFPSLRLSCSSCLAQAALANPVYFFIFHSWWCSRSTNYCHGKWVVGTWGHWRIVQVGRVKEQCFPYLKVPQNTLLGMKASTEVCYRRNVHLCDEYSCFCVFQNPCNFPFLRAG